MLESRDRVAWFNVIRWFPYILMQLSQRKSCIQVLHFVIDPSAYLIIHLACNHPDYVIIKMHHGSVHQKIKEKIKPYELPHVRLQICHSISHVDSLCTTISVIRDDRFKEAGESTVITR